MYTYFPSCNFTKASMKTAIKVRKYFKERMNVGGCCLHDCKTYNDDDIGIIVCQRCRQELEPKLDIISIWEYLDQDEDFVFPDYHGVKMNIQDCYRDREHPEVHEAMRSILRKINVDYIEIENNRENADFCETLYCVPKSDELKAEVAKYPNTETLNLPEDLKLALMKEHVSQYSQEYIVCDCNRCLKGIQLGGGKGIHLLDLVFGDMTL